MLLQNKWELQIHIFYLRPFFVTQWATSSLGRTEGFAEHCEAAGSSTESTLQQAETTLVPLVSEGVETVSIYTILYLLFIFKFWQQLSSF